MLWPSTLPRSWPRGELIDPDNVAHRLIDFPLASAEDSLGDVFDALTADDDENDEDDVAKRQEADQVVEAVVEALNQDLWELFDGILAREQDDQPGDVLGETRNVLLQHRENLMEQVEILAPTPPSLGCESDAGVVLPIARGRR